VTGQVGGVAIAVGFGFDDAAGNALPIKQAHEFFAQQIGRDLAGRPGVKGLGEYEIGA
jgi:hypothetical protein